MSIETMIEATIGKEGGYVDHPADRGGKTIWGITEAVARKNGYTGDMRAMPRSTAVAIYRSEYAIKPGFAAVAEIYPRVGEELFDTGVNMGPARPSMWLQEWLNALNQGGKHWPDIAEDGKIGPGTLAALKAYKKARGAEGENRLLAALNASQGERYKQIARSNPSQEAFVYGWLARLA
ncbi:glycoside hydrolase family 108 protein [Sphingobium sp. CCH11-B1]|uniref:glycoside hydrolase family 108 protein n=1 Tax=Sphingobium sp. CCH11-B1 TaxID=1768781 RepID=UPI00082DBB71|nr:glycosyl hydrolase 108 family protein [Sphingobium sp. CCH11-B1]